MPIYTKKGDRGTTTLFDPALTKGKRIPKDSARVWTIGSLDELNSYLGVASSFLENPQTISFIKEIQRNLFTINSKVAGSRLAFPSSKTRVLERKIDEIALSLPPLKNFILPAGALSAVHLQYARTLARKAERRLVSLSQKEKVSPQILKYLNRLSDLLFILARQANSELKIPEELWKRK